MTCILDPRRLRSVRTTRDIHGADGRLRVAKGATGRVYSEHMGDYGVLFDDSHHFVELSGCKQRFQAVPVIDTESVTL